MTTHSPIGASSMHRWAACPGSVRLSQGLENKSSSYAAEGTVAHMVAEKCLRPKRLLAPSDLIGKVFTVEGHDVTVTEEMADAVWVYLNEVGSGPKTAARLVEHKFDLTRLYPGLYGTADHVRFHHAEELLVVTDFKYGAGIAVEVKDNPQLMYYALGAVLTCGFKAKEVEMVIVQPRCPHSDGPVRRHRIPVTELLDFATQLIDYAKATEDANAPLTAGDHCRFCNAAAVCPELAKRANAAAAQCFAPDAPYDADKLADTLAWLPVLETWIKNTHSFAYAEAEAGRFQHPDWKLVSKTPRRKWRDPVGAEQALRALGLGEATLYPEPEIRSPAQIEKVLPKDKRGILEELTVKESSGHVLVHVSDKRPAVTKQTAAEAFAE